MKKVLTLIVGVFLLVSSATAIGPMNVSFRLGGPFVGAQFLPLSMARLDSGQRFVPSLGISFVSISHDGGIGFSSRGPSIVTTKKRTIKLIMPKLGGRLYGKPVGDLKHYVFFEAFFTLPFIDGENDGVSLRSYEKEQEKDLYTVLGTTMGYGAEYYFSSQFSIGGELFINWVYWDLKDWNLKYYDLSILMGVTIARATFNFYFK